MKKAVLELFIILILFFGTWMFLAQIDWVSILKIEETTESTESKLGDIFWDFISENEKEITSQIVKDQIDTLIRHICKYNDIDKSKFKVHILEKGDINAFALPNNHLLIYSGLIESCDNERALMGILGHEIAHLQKNHVMKKLIKEVSLSVLIGLTTGQNNVIIQQIVKALGSSAYDRALEREADMVSVEYLLKAHIDPESFANFLYKMSDKENLPSQIYWVTSHPDSKERAENIINYLKDKSIENENVLTQEKWNNLKKILKNQSNK